MSEVKMLSRDDILKARDIKRELVDMAPFDWGGSVYVKGMSGLDRGQFEVDMNLTKGPNQSENWKRFRARMLVACVVGEDDQPLFREQDVDALNEKSAAALDHLTDIAQRLSGFRRQDVDEITKNSQGGQSEGSTTA